MQYRVNSPGGST